MRYGEAVYSPAIFKEMLRMSYPEDDGQEPGSTAESAALADDLWLPMCEGNFIALDGVTGKPLWHFQMGGAVYASPMA